jgi:glyoxylase-like metal-dependent hydrolase (beta-lactamase superfamily II)
MKHSKGSSLKATLVIGAMIGATAVFFLSRSTSPRLPRKIIPLDLGITTVYLVKHDRGYLQVDTGYQNDLETYKALLRKKKIEITEITHLFLSHHHDDHVGFVNELIQLNPAVKVVMNEKTVPLIRQGVNNKENGGGLVNRSIYLMFRIKQLMTPSWDLTFPPFTPHENTVAIKQEWDYFQSETGQNIKILPTPGHTSDSTSLLVDDVYLLCGDMASSFLLWAGSKNLTLFNENLDDVYASWDKVIALGVKVVLPSHGAPFSAGDLSRNMRRYQQGDLVRFF